MRRLCKSNFLLNFYLLPTNNFIKSFIILCKIAQTNGHLHNYITMNQRLQYTIKLLLQWSREMNWIQLYFFLNYLEPPLRLQKQVTRITVPNYPNRPENVRKINIKVIQTSLKTVLSCSIPLLTCSENSLMYGQFTPFLCLIPASVSVFQSHTLRKNFCNSRKYRSKLPEKV